MYKYLKKLSDDKILYQKMAANALIYAKKNHNIKKNSIKLLQLCIKQKEARNIY